MSPITRRLALGALLPVAACRPPSDLDADSVKEATLRVTQMAEEYHARTKSFAGAIQSRLRITLGLIHQLRCLSLGFRGDVVSIALGLVDEFFAIFFGVGHVFKCRGHGFRGIDVL